MDEERKEKRRMEVYARKKIVNGIEYEEQFKKPKTTEEVVKRDDEKAMFAYELAKKICDFTESNREVEDIIMKIKCNFSWFHSNQKPKIYDNPMSAGGYEMTMPEAEATGKEN